MCPLCNANSETQCHALFTFPNVKEMWDLMGFGELILSSEASLLELFESRNDVEEEKVSVVGVVTWMVWFRHNQVVFAGGDCLTKC